MDLYIFASPYRVTWDYYFLAREHTLEIKEGKDLQNKNVCFKFQQTLLSDSVQKKDGHLHTRTQLSLPTL